MVLVRKALFNDIYGIRRVCVEGYRATYKNLLSNDYIERTIDKFYNLDRLANEVTNPEGWDGWFVALENGEVVGAGGGGMTSENTGEVFVLYLDPTRRGEGIGSLLLKAISDEQLAKGATEQWVSVQMNNEKGIPFYKARGFQYHSEQRTYESEKADHAISLRLVRKLQRD
ncbi:ribosomal protein S18 acetylase RimI-like enzyme [Salirhabdus euzebyi]|uniref:Ribosomal protein S18 acetylase RimI-like enzyme n=1 Tax=Salirhabdus euzebyi TaxID=394506 RepID=A0A841Q6N9_9BACI|nr:GNAT family N-acetyltransferase [Salirhabdus euzebyi]MBB6454080.1 ribosomal protein S18 acetylase RimI-like enzyme [Salirhabdus euzebyi]